VHVAFDSIPKRFAIDQEAEVSIETGADKCMDLPRFHGRFRGS